MNPSVRLCGCVNASLQPSQQETLESPPININMMMEQTTFKMLNEMFPPLTFGLHFSRSLSLPLSLLLTTYGRGLQRFQAKDPLVKREMQQGPPQPYHRFHIVSLCDSTIISLFWIHVNLCFQIFNHLNHQYLINLTFHSVLFPLYTKVICRI